MPETLEPRSVNPRWPTTTSEPRPSAMADTSVHRFLGGSPVTVALRLFFVSLIVGAILMWMDIRPFDIFYGVEQLVRRLWSLGFQSVRELAEYVVAGAVIVVPIWLIARLLSGGRPAR